MKVYIESEHGDPHGLLKAVVRAVKWLPITPTVYLTSHALQLYIELKCDTYCSMLSNSKDLETSD